MRKPLLWVGVLSFTFIVVLAAIFIYQLTPVQVQTGVKTICLNTPHQGETLLGSTVQTLSVPRKDAGKYSITTKQVLCATCQRRRAEEAARVKAQRQKEESFVKALRKHDDSVLLACRDIAAVLEGGESPYSLNIRSQIYKIKRLARSGKQLCAPQSLGEIENLYGKSMDELLLAMTSMQSVLENDNMDNLRAGPAHMLLSKMYRDEAISKLASHGWPD